MGVSPTAFVRYLSRQVQENERNAPFILYVDTHQEVAAHTADEISQVWQVPVLGVSLQNLKSAIAMHPGRVKILVNHMMCDSVRAMLRRNKSDAIPIELNSVRPATLIIEKIKPNSSVLVLYMPQASHQCAVHPGGSETTDGASRYQGFLLLGPQHVRMSGS